MRSLEILLRTVYALLLLISIQGCKNHERQWKASAYDPYARESRWMRCGAWFYGIYGEYEETGVLPTPNPALDRKIRWEMREYKPMPPMDIDTYSWSYGPIHKETPDPKDTSRAVTVHMVQSMPGQPDVMIDYELPLDLTPPSWGPFYESIAEKDAPVWLNRDPDNLARVVACAVWFESKKAKRWITQPDLLRADKTYTDADDQHLLDNYSARIEKRFDGKRAWFEKNDNGGWIVVRNETTGVEYWFPDDGPDSKRISVTMTPDGKRVCLQ